MAISGDQIAARIRAALPDATTIDVADTTGGGDHWAATVVSETFRGKTLIDRHRAVYAALGDLMRAEIHALALHTLTPDEPRRT